MNIIASNKSIKLFAFPEELVGDNPTLIHTQSSLLPILPTVIQRSDSEPLEKVAELYEWFKANLGQVTGGYLVASAALPALSLDKGIWNSALAELKDALSGFTVVEGPIYVSSVGCTRSNHFEVADWYRQRLHGSVTVVMAVVKRPKSEVADIPPEYVMPNNHLVSGKAVKEKTVEKEV